MEHIITEELKNLMKQLSEQTEKDRKRRWILLCKDENGRIIPSDVYIGNESPTTITEKMQCPENTTEVGIFHSNPTV